MKMLSILFLLFSFSALANPPSDYQLKKDCQDLMREAYNPSIRCPMSYIKADWDRPNGSLHCSCTSQITNY